MSSPYSTLLEALRLTAELPEFPDPLPSNQLELSLEEGPTITIDLEEESGMVQLFCEVGTYPEEKELETLQKICEANFLWAATCGGTLSARPEEQTVYFAYQFPVESLEGEEFVSLVAQFVSVIQEWEKILTAIAEGTLADLEKANAPEGSETEPSSEEQSEEPPKSDVSQLA